MTCGFFEGFEKAASTVEGIMGVTDTSSLKRDMRRAPEDSPSPQLFKLKNQSAPVVLD